MSRFVQIVNGVLRGVSQNAIAIYDESTEITSTLTSGSPLTLPSGQTYEGSDLKVFFNGQAIETVRDYNFVGSAPRTQVSFTFDLEPGDVIRFRIN